MARQPYAVWNRSPSSADRSTDPNDASNRILDDFFTPQRIRGDLVLQPGQEVFTMGSCFAREIEHALRKRDFIISSMDLAYLESGDFLGPDGKVSVGFFHRYNVPSMEVEFRRAVDDLPFDDAVSLLVAAGDEVHDLNYGLTLPRRPLDGVLARRAHIKRLVARFTQARVVIVTLGLSEAWFHKPSGLFCNAVPGDLLARRREDFEFRVVGYDENLTALQSIGDCLARHSEVDHRVVVTVSPVPLQSTFTDDDIVVANYRSKATLRAVAESFCQTNPRAIYFPSFEIAMYSNPALVWRPDRVHIEPRCVAHITDTFVKRFVQTA